MALILTNYYDTILVRFQFKGSIEFSSLLSELLSTFLRAYQIISIFTRVFMQIISVICNAMNEKFLFIRTAEYYANCKD